MNSRGHILQEPRFDQLEFSFSPEFALAKTEGKYGIVSKRSGQLVIPPEYDWVGEWQGETAHSRKSV